MLTKERIRSLFGVLNDLLRERGEIGEIGLVGGAVMCLVYNTMLTPIKNRLKTPVYVLT
jgi:hypothetical protein